MMRSIRRLSALFALPLLAVLSLPLHAADLCVGTVAAFDNALVVAQFIPDTRILLQQGTYHVGGSYFMTYDVNVASLTIEGGYNGDCSARIANADNTIIDGDLVDADQRLVVYGNVTIDAIRFQNFHSPDFPSGLYIQHQDVDGQQTTINACRFYSMGFHEYRIGAGNATTRLVDNLVVNAPEGIQLYYQGYGSPFEPVDSVGTILVNNTVVNSGDYGIFIESAGSTTLSNNIAWNNANRDIYLEIGDGNNTVAAAFFQDTTYGTRYGVESPGSFGTLFSDPQFAAVNDFHLLNTSPAINSGTVSVPGGLPYTDLDGNLRVVGSAPDRGAYESTFDDTQPFILTVTNTADSGAGSLRQAITNANGNPDVNIITFDIPGACPQTIDLASDLPGISAGVFINGFTQPGSIANTAPRTDNAKRCVILNSTGSATGLFFVGPPDSQLILEGLAMEGFSTSAVTLAGGTGHAVQGMQFGGLVAPGVTLAANGIDILLGGNATGSTIGGSDPGVRNVIGGATNYGVFLPSNPFANATGNFITGNLIGLAPNGLDANPNGVGVYVGTANNTVDYNTISGNSSDGVRLAGANATGDLVGNNGIGVKSGFVLCSVPPFPACTPADFALPNGRHGVRIEGGSNHERINFNQIASNAVMGISVASGLDNKLFANAIHDNASYGIDLEGVGLNDNDTLQSALDLPNRGLNFPVIARAYGGLHHGRVEGELDSINDNYVLQIFSNKTGSATGYGQGETFLGLGAAFITNASSGHNGTGLFSIPFAAPSQSLSTRAISMLALDPAGNTSEFSAWMIYNCDVIFSDGVDGDPSETCPVTQ